MRTYKIWDVQESTYRINMANNKAPQSTWDKRSSAIKVAGRICEGPYEIHVFKLERVYE